ncbi:N-acetyltransferase [Nocardioides sp.]|nr:N-acetyltransferase [Nocardioides sp.]
MRAATAQDLPRVAEIYAPYVTDTVSTFETEVPELATWHERYDAVLAAQLPFLVAELDGRVCGYAYATPWKVRAAYRHTAETSIYLDPAAQGRGVGGALLDALVAGCAEAGRRELIAVIADSGSPASPALHTTRGFVTAGRLRNVGLKHDRWIDTILMQLSMDPG